MSDHFDEGNQARQIADRFPSPATSSTELWHLYWMRQTGKWESNDRASVACGLEEALDIIEWDTY